MVIAKNKSSLELGDSTNNHSYHHKNNLKLNWRV